LNNQDVFYTDSNALEMQRRVYDKRPDFNFNTFEKASGSYYPINSAVAIVDTETNV